MFSGKGVRDMAMEAIQKVTRSEQAAQEEKARAQAEAKGILAQAHREGQQLVEQARAQAEEQVRALLEQAREDADRRTGEAGAESRAQCQRLKQEAEARLDQAAALIVERIGNR